MSVQMILFFIAVVCWFIKGVGVNTGQFDMFSLGWMFVGLGVIFG